MAAIGRIRPSAVYHCAGAAHVGRSWDTTCETLATNVRATHYLLDALERTDSPVRVMIPSSALVYAPSNDPLTEDHQLLPDSPYGVSKLAQEMLGERTSDALTVTIARSFNHFGPRQDPQFVASGFARRIADIEKGRGEAEIAVGNLEAQRDLTDVRDTVRAYRLILERRPGAASLQRLLRTRHSDSPPAGSPARPRSRGGQGDGGSGALPAERRAPRWSATPTGCAEELGWTPTIPLEQTLDDLLEYWRAQP